MEKRLGYWLAIGMLWAVATSTTRGAVPSETLLPEATFRYVSAADFPKLVQQWRKTQLGQLLQDPVMEPFLKDLRRQLEERSGSWRELLGLTVDDVREVIHGELALAQLRATDANSQPSTILLADVSGNGERAAAVLEKVSARLVEAKAKKSALKIAGATLTVFELPKQEAQVRQVERVAFFLHEDVLGASDNPKALQAVLQRMRGQKSPTLAGLPAYQTVMERLGKDAGGATPQLRWFVQPFDANAPKPALPTGKKRPTKSTLQQLDELGFSAVRGIGGFVDLAVDNYQVVHRTWICAPQPHTKALEMLQLPNSEELAAPTWSPRDVAGCTVVSFDLLHAFDNFGPVFNMLMGGEEEEDVWADVLAGLKDPQGPGVDLRELVAQLAGRAYLLSRNAAPISATSERLLLAIPASDPEAVAAGIAKIMKTERTFEAHPFEKAVIWDALPPKTKSSKVALEMPGGQKAAARKPQRGSRQDLFPEMAVTVAQGHLLIASHHDFLVDVLKQTDARTSLGGTVEYQQVSEALKQLGAGSNALCDFSRTDEQLWPVYELLRQGQLPQSRSLFGRLVSSLAQSSEPGQERKPAIDGSQMPDYETIRRYLGPAGAFLTSEPDGWFVKGAVLTK